MRMIITCAGWALSLTATGLLLAGILEASPGVPGSGASAAMQVADQQWMLARGFQHMLLAGIALLAALAAFILARLPAAPIEVMDWQGDLARIARAVEAQRREQAPRQ